ncbi:MAG: hypothetical protein ACOYLB_16535 [Phototrophicaceae bacterium]
MSYQVHYDRDDDGTFAMELTAGVRSLTWRLGMAKPFERVAQVATARVVVSNHDQAYSGDAPSIQLGHHLRIQYAEQVLYVGELVGIEPLAGELGGRTACLVAVCPLDALSRLVVELTPLTNCRAEEVVRHLLRQVWLRPQRLFPSWWLNLNGANALGENTVLIERDSLIPATLETGVSVWEYVGWEDRPTAREILRDVAESERGRVFVNRNGEVVLHNRHHLYQHAGVATLLDNNMDALTVQYAHDYATSVRLVVQQRTLGEAHSVLWRLGFPVRLMPQASTTLTATFHDEINGFLLSALTLDTPQAQVDYSVRTSNEGGADWTAWVPLEMGALQASSVQLTFINTTTRVLWVQAGMMLRGTPMRTHDPIVLEVVDRIGQVRYGQREAVIVSPLMGNLETAQQRIRYELRQRNTQHLTAHTLTHSDAVLARALTLFDRITLKEAHTQLEGDYWIIGEVHTVTHGGAHHRVEWTLEPVDTTRYWQVGTDTLGHSTRLLY